MKSARLLISRDPRVVSVKDAYAGSIVMPGINVSNTRGFAMKINYL